jgi:hypothetical protein
MTRWQRNAGVLLLCAFVGAQWTYRVSAQSSVSDDNLASWVEQRIRDWQPTPDERRIDQIGWAKDICDAETLSKIHKRPVFLFTYDGRDMATQRC